MTITIKTGADIDGMRIAGRLASEVLDMLTPQISALDKTTRVVHELLGMLYYRLIKFQ